MSAAINDGEPGTILTREGDQQSGGRFVAAGGESAGHILAFPGVPVAQFASGSYPAPAFPSWLRRFFADLS